MAVSCSGGVDLCVDTIEKAYYYGTHQFFDNDYKLKQENVSYHTVKYGVYVLCFVIVTFIAMAAIKIAKL